MVHASRNILSIIIQQDATIYSVFISVNCSTYFGWYLHPSSGAHITVSTVSGINEKVTATCRERDWMGTAVPTFTTGSSNGLSNARYCRYSDELLMMGGESTRNMQSSLQIQISCILVHLVGQLLTKNFSVSRKTV